MRIRHVSWRHKIIKKSIREKTGQEDMENIFRQRRLPIGFLAHLRPWLNLEVLLLWAHPTGTRYLSYLETFSPIPSDQFRKHMKTSLFNPYWSVKTLTRVGSASELSGAIEMFDYNYNNDKTIDRNHGWTLKRETYKHFQRALTFTITIKKITISGGWVVTVWLCK